MLMLSAPVGNETVDVRDSGRVDLGSYECRDINRSTVIQRACYDKDEHTLIVAIKGSYSKYCGLPAETFDGFMSAPSMGQFFKLNIAASGPDIRYACREQRRSTR